ncbi:amidase family protein [Congregibacter sp.]|uniref:amidase family protein n=1 Tax=Congregibacter sp. TaxID=2744308 RepID=UPI003F6B29BE
MQYFPNIRSLTVAVLMVLLSATAPGKAAEIELTQATIIELNAAMDAGALNSEQLVQRYLDRIAAYDQQGPTLNTVMHLNPNALARARELDLERKTTGRRSPLHGIPVIIKDNLDTADMPTTAGSFMLDGSLPPDDAFVVQQLRDAGAIILAKLNLSEFASGGALNSLGGVIANPHHLGRTPSGSSGGTGSAIAAGFASMGLGTDTGGSVRGPSSANGIVGLKTTHGLLSRDGVVPLALSFDTVGPMTRSVTDLAVSLGVMTGVDPADKSTQKSTGKSYTDYSQFLDADSLKGARIGVARVFMGDDGEVDWLVESALQSMRDAGAEIIDVEFPDWLLESRGKFYRAIRYPEFKAQIAEYLATLDGDYPKDLEGLISEAMTLNAAREDGVIPNPSRWSLMQKEVKATDLEGFEYQAVKKHALPLVAQTIAGLMNSNTLDAIVYPTSSSPADLIERPAGTSEPGSGGSPVILANLSGFPDLILPIGFTGRGMPVTLSLMGTAFSEPRLIGLAYALEQRLQAIRTPVHTPPLPGSAIRYD